MVTVSVSDSSSDQSVPEDDPGGSRHRTDGLLSEGYREERLFAPLQRLLATFSSKRVSGCALFNSSPPVSTCLIIIASSSNFWYEQSGQGWIFFPWVMKDATSSGGGEKTFVRITVSGNWQNSAPVRCAGATARRDAHGRSGGVWIALLERAMG